MSPTTVTDLFSIKSKAYPNNIALEFYEQSLSYAELERKSNQLANYLIKCGIKPKTLVPILAERSFEMIIGILAILKVGAAYVPIDPASPTIRKTYIIDELNATVLLTTIKSKMDFEGTSILLDQDAELIDQMPDSAPIIAKSEDDLSYIIFTSGSTGNPKGVMIQNKALTSFIGNQGDYYGIKDSDRILMFSSYSFDASVEQLFLALTNGACLILLDDELLLDVERFSTYIENKKVNHLDGTPGFLENLDPKRFTAVKRIIAGGDVCRKSLFLKWKDQVEFYNVYGPTEACVTAISYKCNADDEHGLHTIPIGKSLKGVSIFLLNKEQKLVAHGEVGEIYLGGNQLAKGYLNQNAITQERFISIPNISDERLYRTGDTGKWLEGNNLEFIGRIDDQVKIRGYRVELGEIENVISTFPQIRQCVVLAKETPDLVKQLVAFIVSDTTINKKEIEGYLAGRLPEYMVPRLWVELKSVPLTVNGKIDKNLLLIPDSAELLTNTYVAPKTAQEKILANIWKQVLGVRRVGVTDNFFDLGGNSLSSQRVIIAMDAEQFTVPISKLYQFPSISGILKYIASLKQSIKRNQNQTKKELKSEVAVIGMAGRFPGAETIDELWALLCEGKETTTFFRDDELEADLPKHLTTDELYVKARGVIKNPTMFDPSFFGINKKLAELMDPQQRIFLEIAWEVLEKAGHLPSKSAYKTGVFAGCGPNFYYENNILAHPDKIENLGKLQVTTVNDKDYIASRTAYHLNLKGPAININSACSTSLLAILEAVNSLRAGQCELAIAGGSSINASINSGHLYQEGSILSRDGHCRPFDDQATGTVFSDGSGIVLLKMLADAERDGDKIYAVIKGVGVSNDGADKASFTAPSAQGQAEAISSAIIDAGIEASEISYIETHGTGTPIGDPIEFDGLVDAFGNQEKQQYCAIGSIKSNFGHLTEAAGVASFIKTCLSLHHQKLLPSIGFEVPNKNINFNNSPFFVNTKLSNWESENRIAGVSSFGVGGTNVHLIVSEYQNQAKYPVADQPYSLLTWSAATDTSLQEYGKIMEEHVLNNHEVNAQDLAYSLGKSRHDFNHREFLVIDNKQSIAQQMAAHRTQRSTVSQLLRSPDELVFAFPGQGAQFETMGIDLYENELVYKAAIDECGELLKEFISTDIREIIFVRSTNGSPNLLKNTQFTQPALFATEYAMAKLWMSWGYKPDLFCGHSVGEYVAAHFAGIFTLKDALMLVAFRGLMISKLPEGSMLSVRYEHKKIADLLTSGLSIAAINTDNLCVVAGPHAEIDAFKNVLDQLEIPNKALFTSHAFHSAMMDPVIPAFRELVAQVICSTPQIPIISSVTGQLLSDEEALSTDYWANHLRQTVKFSAAIENIIENYNPTFLEVGPGQTLTTLIKQISMAKKIAVTAVASLPLHANGSQSTLTAIGNMWNAGVTTNWDLFYKTHQLNFIELPTYRFDRQKYWVDAVNNNLIAPVHGAKNAQNPAGIPDNENIEMRKNNLIASVKKVIEDASGIELDQIDLNKHFIEIGLDSLLLTQVAASLKKEFQVPITFRQLNDDCGSITLLVNYLCSILPEPEVIAIATPIATPTVTIASDGSYTALSLVSAQLELLAKQIQLINNTQTNISPIPLPGNSFPAKAPIINKKPAQENNNDELTAADKAILSKPFGATPKIEKTNGDLTEKQDIFLKDLISSYNKKTIKSKTYTDQSRSFMADPRVVNGFKPATKELVYPIVISQSAGSKMWDLDGNEYIDALNGFGSNMLGYQPACVKEALHQQIEKGFEVGPQHQLAAEVSQLICDFTKFDRVGLCSTGSEAVLGCIRLARTVTGKSLIVAFTGSYHGIFDEVLVRGTKKLKSYPAAAGIMAEAVQNILILDYGTDETLAIIKERANEIAGVLVEPIQSRRPEFIPLQFLKELRTLTNETAIPLIFDEVITGFRMAPGGAQELFGIKADLAAYGKVVGAGIPIGVIAGKRFLMDALDGGSWNYGDQSTPEVGITYFAGTFVRHPLALAAAKASLNYMKSQGASLQQKLNDKGNFISKALNHEFSIRQLPIIIVNYGSMWKLKFEEEIPYSELLFVLLRERGIHILDGFPCFMTEATSYHDIDKIINAFVWSMDRMIDAGFFKGTIPGFGRYDQNAIVIDNSNPPLPGARLGKDKFGNPEWFIADPNDAQLFLQIKAK
ncbi:amino acid adenylation domain-containing protein [Pedobacter frigidisoli]|uniref:Amino acid adenylation domain-containing protein n=1 Tax=Pedobacter frigidisoli TaxID=2530455 RepID=A0A4R0NSE1_9SPHI|nr:polyketide synthase [Pedobacter frigidisoli]TCD02004.1 amino acid adenylation domain-containing protein [Pedobacter frigidisoli]